MIIYNYEKPNISFNPFINYCFTISNITYFELVMDSGVYGPAGGDLYFYRIRDHCIAVDPAAVFKNITKMIIRSTKLLRLLSWSSSINGITLFPLIILKDDDHNPVRINHEKIHIRQQLECLIIPFYLVYFIEFIFSGYRGISFEKEAYTNQNNLDYLKTRKLWAFFNYM